jgi:hypothetical protein
MAAAEIQTCRRPTSHRAEPEDARISKPVRDTGFRLAYIERLAELWLAVLVDTRALVSCHQNPSVSSPLKEAMQSTHPMSNTPARSRAL